MSHFIGDFMIYIFKRQRIVSKTGKARFVWTYTVNGKTITAPLKQLKLMVKD